MHNLEKDALEMAARRQTILEAGFKVFSEHGIDAVPMTDIAKEAGIGIATLYRYFPNKEALASGISAWCWAKYNEENQAYHDENIQEDCTAAEELSFFLDSFIELYRNHKDILRYNQFYNIFVLNQGVSPAEMSSYMAVVEEIERRFNFGYEKALQDHTVRTDISEPEMFSAAIHLMLAAATRYAVGVVLNPESAEKELELLKQMFLKEYVISDDR